MLTREHRIYFSSAFCEQVSDKAHFKVNLPLSLELSGDWKCAIRDIFISNKSTSNLDYIYVLGDFCETSFIQENKQLPILKKIYLSKREKYYSFIYPLYVPIKQKEISSFELEFLDSNFKAISLKENFLIECTLHFYKYGG